MGSNHFHNDATAALLNLTTIFSSIYIISIYNLREVIISMKKHWRIVTWKVVTIWFYNTRAQNKWITGFLLEQKYIKSVP